LRNVQFSNIFKHHIDIDVKASQSADQFLVPLHDHPYLGSYTPVYELCFTQSKQIPDHSTYTLTSERKKEKTKISTAYVTKKKDGTNVDDERATSSCSLEKAEDRSTFHQLGKKNLLDCIFTWRITNFEA
jgi:hypothetical protein